MKKYILSLLFSISAFADVDCVHCIPTNKSTSSPELTDLNKVVNRCISFGEKSVSGKLQTSGFIYKTASGFKVIYDGDDYSRMGQTFATKVEIDTQVSCNDSFKGQVTSSDFESSEDLKTSGPISFSFPAGLCPSQSIKLRIMSPTCMSPSPGCDKLIAKETVSINGNNLLWLDNISEDEVKKLPCFKH